MPAPEPTLESVKGDLDKLREVARAVYGEHPSRGDSDAWSLNDYLAGVDELEDAIDRAMSLPPRTKERYEAEKYARNVLAVRLYFRGRLCLRTGTIGRFYRKVGEKNVHWAPTELSRMADRLAAEPLRLVYRASDGYDR